MGISRYNFSQRIEVGTKIAIGNSYAITSIREVVDRGLVSYSTRIIQEGERLDQIAGELYGDSSYWWIIAAASGIGWGLQIAPGTLLRIPNSIESVLGALI